MKNKKKYILFAAILLIIVAAIIVENNLNSEKTPAAVNNSSKNNADTANLEKNKPKLDSNFIKATTTLADSFEEAIRLSDSPAGNPEFIIDAVAGSSAKTTFSGPRINIAITGIDGRLGTKSQHADANHVISIITETGEIEITSVPRDTYCDLGYEDSTGLNKLTICRSNKGRNRYLQELARIARLDKIHYYVEFGFSQAMGIIEWLGHKRPSNTLQVLRARKGFGDDFQRCYNQGQFIRQAILSHFEKFTGTFGSVFLRGGLLFVETNLTYKSAADIVEKLKSTGFPQKPDCVVVRVRPAIKIQFKSYDFTNQEIVDELSKKIENFNKPRFEKSIESPQPKINVAARLLKVLEQAVKDSAKRPTQVINRLSPYYSQRAWHQVENLEERKRLRDIFGELLANAYLKRGKTAEAAAVKETIEAEKQLFEKK